MSPRRLGGVVLLLVAATLTLPAPPASSAADPVASSVLASYVFDDGVVGLPVPQPITNLGVGDDLVASVVTLGSGQALVAGSRPGQVDAVELPSLAQVTGGQRAVMKVTDTDLTDGDTLNLGTQDFTLAADFDLEADSEGDGGNNLVQRGLASSVAQYKIQVDVAKGNPWPVCALGQTVNGSWVHTAVTSPKPIVPGEWYQARCQRVGSQLTLSVLHYAADGTSTLLAQKSKAIPVYDLTWPATAAAPLSIGGKLRVDGTLAPKGGGDQFNGLVDNVSLQVP